MSFIAERVAGLRLFQFDASDNVSRVRLGNFVELLALRRVQRAQAFRSSSRRVVNRRIGADFAAENFEDVDAAGERIGNRPEAVGRKWFAARVFP